MTNLPTELTINSAVIVLSRSFLQYVAESWPWVDKADRGAEEQVQALAARQRRDVAEIVQLLVDRDWPIDFGSFPTEYTDLHFISLSTLLDRLQTGQRHTADRLTAVTQSLRDSFDKQATVLMESVTERHSHVGASLQQLQQKLSSSPIQT